MTVISPYPEAVDAAEHRFFAEGGGETPPLRPAQTGAPLTGIFAAAARVYADWAMDLD